MQTEMLHSMITPFYHVSYTDFAIVIAKYVDFAIVK